MRIETRLLHIMISAQVHASWLVISMYLLRAQPGIQFQDLELMLGVRGPAAARSADAAAGMSSCSAAFFLAYIAQSGDPPACHFTLLDITKRHTIG